MMCKNIKTKRGFSLVELMVVVAIMGTLAAIAIPAYNEYRKSAKKAAYRSDLNSLHKGWLAFGVELDSFCERETSPTVATIANVGMKSLTSSNLYDANIDTPTCVGSTGADEPACINNGGLWKPKSNGPGKNNFIGFGNENCTGTAPTLPALQLSSVSTDAGCVLNISTYNMGVFGHVSGKNFYRARINQDGVVQDGDDQRSSPGTLLLKTNGADTC